MTGTHDGQEAPMDDDFDDFAEEQEDDFGDFDDGFQGPSENVAEESTTTPPQQGSGLSVPPLLDFDTIETLSDISSALETPLDRLFPGSKDTTTSLPPVEPIDNASAIFHTDRSISLWSQLVAPPPLQPQNWVKSRIRRLFLVSLGVPVDLDEILPASKQKKLVLPSIDLGSETGQQQGHGSKYGTATSQASSAVDPNTATSSPSTAQPHHHHHHHQQQQQQKQQQPPSSTTSAPASSYSRRRLPTPPPDLDLSAVSRLYATTDAALSNLTDSELRAHIAELQQTTQRATAVVEYWVKRLDGLVGEKEAFEGVIENLVSHARRVRK